MELQWLNFLQPLFSIKDYYGWIQEPSTDYDDSDESSCEGIAKCLEIAETVIFCNGGDRGKTNTPEVDKYGEDPRVQFEFGIGGDDKMNSSSWILHGYFERQRKLLGI